MARPILFGTGWVPDPPDPRDLHFGHDDVREMLSGTAVHAGARALRRGRGPTAVDLRRWCSPVHYQGYYNTCTCHVVTSMVELLENKANGSYVPASRLFLYQVAKRLLGETGDPGVYLRQTMGTVVLTGVPPEKYWPYLDTDRKDDPRVDAEPDAFCYALARDFGGARYFRLDTADAEADEVRTRVQACLAASIPASIGFPLYRSSLERAAQGGEVSMPAEGEAPVGSHAVLVVGFDDEKRIGGDGVEETTGAFLFKNSWGADWGAEGYGWLPYRYLGAGLAKDCWTMMRAKWVETDAFQLDLEVANGAEEPDRTGAEAEAPEPQPPSRRSRARASATRSRSSSPSPQKDTKAR